MAKRTQACRNCRRFTTEKACPFCKSTNLSTSWKGVVVVLNADSDIARMLEIKEPGKYVLYVG